jgi:hypothetical protein
MKLDFAPSIQDMEEVCQTRLEHKWSFVLILKQQNPTTAGFLRCCGEGGIRTLGTVSRTSV